MLGGRMSRRRWKNKQECQQNTQVTGDMLGAGSYAGKHQREKARAGRGDGSPRANPTAEEVETGESWAD